MGPMRFYLEFELPAALWLFICLCVFLQSCRVDSSGYHYEPLVPVSDARNTPYGAPPSNIPASNEEGDIAALADVGIPDEGLVDLEEGVPAELPSFSGGQCPVLKEGLNDFNAGSMLRQVSLFLPAAPPNDMPLLFLWHDQGDNLVSFSANVGAESVAEQQGALVLAIGGRVSSQPWNFSSLAAAAEELQLFNDVLACLDAQYSIDRRRIYSMGFGAGATWAAHLIGEGSEIFASVALFNPEVESYASAQRPVPVIVSWGGQGLSFDAFGNPHDYQDSALSFLDNLREDGHSAVACAYLDPMVIPQDLAQGVLELLLGISWTENPYVFSDLALLPSSCLVYDPG